MQIKERIKVFVDNQKISISQFEKNCNLSNGYVQSMRLGFGVTKLENVLKAYPNLSKEWLLYGNGEMLNPIQVQNSILQEPPPAYNLSDKDELIKELRETIRFQRELLNKLTDKIKRDE